MEDLISRQAVLDLPRIKTHNEWGNVIKESVDVEDVKHLPSVNPQPKTGHWETSGDYFTGAYETIDYVRCSRCGYDSLEEGNYCPNCGARMED